MGWFIFPLIKQEVLPAVAGVCLGINWLAEQHFLFSTIQGHRRGLAHPRWREEQPVLTVGHKRAASIRVRSETAPIHGGGGQKRPPPRSPPCEWLLWVVWLLKFEDAFWGAACLASHWCQQLSNGWTTSWVAQCWWWVTNAYNVYALCPDGSDRRRGTLGRALFLWIPSVLNGNTEMEQDGPTSKETFNRWIQPWR